MLEIADLHELPAAELAALPTFAEDLAAWKNVWNTWNDSICRSIANKTPRNRNGRGTHGSLRNTLFHTPVPGIVKQVLLRSYEGFSVVMGRIRAHMRRFHVREPSRRWSHLIVEEHRRILLAIRNGDPETARKAMGTHLDETARVLYSLPEQPLFPGGEK